MSDFRDDDQKPPWFPLNLLFCDDCWLAQLDTSVPRHLMYHDRYGFKSGVNETVRADLASVVADAFRWKPKARSWLDIASNDGTLLSNVPENIYRVGVDPVEFLCRQAEQHADQVHNDYFQPSLLDRKFDVVTSVSVFYDLDDPHAFVEDVYSVMARGAVWVVQQNYLADMLRLNAVDNVCHEHITYWSLLALDNLLSEHDLEVVDVSTSSVNGGVFRTVIAERGTRQVRESVERVRRQEQADRLDTAAPFGEFSGRVCRRLARLRDLVGGLHDQGDTIFVYGASTRGSTLLQAANLGPPELECAVERNPAKVGKTMASIGLPIVSEQQARERKPDYMLALPWFFRGEFLGREADYIRSGGRFIFPLPDVEVLP